jgi:hypothetical protein
VCRCIYWTLLSAFLITVPSNLTYSILISFGLVCNLSSSVYSLDLLLWSLSTWRHRFEIEKKNTISDMLRFESGNRILWGQFSPKSISRITLARIPSPQPQLNFTHVCTATTHALLSRDQSWSVLLNLRSSSPQAAQVHLVSLMNLILGHPCVNIGYEQKLLHLHKPRRLQKLEPPCLNEIYITLASWLPMLYHWWILVLPESYMDRSGPLLLIARYEPSLRKKKRCIV